MMMKLFVFFCALTAVLAQTSQQNDLKFSFNQTDGVSDPQLMTLPFDFAGYVNITIDEPHTDLWLCMHWIVPVVAPYGVDSDLDTIWNSTCTNFQNIPASMDAFSSESIPLRAGDYYVTAALAVADMDSTGIIDTTQFDFTATFSYLECPTDMFGEQCIHPYTFLSLGENNLLSLGQTAQYFALPTVDNEANGRFASSLGFMFESDGADVIFTMVHRMMGAPDQLDDGKQCGDANDCAIMNPPAIATPDFQWGIKITASDDVTANITVSYKYCPMDTIGNNCDDYVVLDTEVGEIKKFTDATTLVFDNSVSIAVAALDGYVQQPIGPRVLVQFDAKPVTVDGKENNNVLMSQGAQANVVMIDVQNADTQIVLYIDNQSPGAKSFGIWKVDANTQCPNGCDNHGSCSSLEYVCMCDPKYEDLDCGHEVKDFTIEYIILIAVGSLLILSIVIGVPIYCFLNRNQEYETVA